MKLDSQSRDPSNIGVDAQNPWPGLVAFTERWRDFFHGRVAEADDLIRRVARKNLTVLFGQSGLGKSSLLQAGLFPRLRSEGFLPVPIRLDHAVAAPPLADQVKVAFTTALANCGGDALTTEKGFGDSLWEFLHRRNLVIRSGNGESICPVLVFDQFEELFAIGQASEATRVRAAAFLVDLADLVENRAPESLEQRLETAPELVKQFDFDHSDYRVLICLREDYLAHLEDLRPAIPSIAENRLRLTRMNGERGARRGDHAGRWSHHAGGRSPGRVFRGGRRSSAGPGFGLASRRTAGDGGRAIALEPRLS